MSNCKEFVVATPVVWAGAGPVSHFAGNMSELMMRVNKIAETSRAHVKLVRAFMDVHSAGENRLLSFPNVDIQACEREESERRQKGMAHWWYSCVAQAVNEATDVHGVLYYPIDVCWDDTADNTVVNPFRVCSMLKELACMPSEALVLGSYVSANAGKELIEKLIHDLVCDAYPALSSRPEISRVRTEFWAITPALFRAFEKVCPEGDHLRKAADPTLLLLLYCLQAEKPIFAFDLGSYRAEGDYTNDKISAQVRRACKLIQDYQRRFTGQRRPPVSDIGR